MGGLSLWFWRQFIWSCCVSVSGQIVTLVPGTWRPKGVPVLENVPHSESFGPFEALSHLFNQVMRSECAVSLSCHIYILHSFVPHFSHLRAALSYLLMLLQPRCTHWGYSAFSLRATRPALDLSSLYNQTRWGVCLPELGVPPCSSNCKVLWVRRAEKPCWSITGKGSCNDKLPGNRVGEAAWWWVGGGLRFSPLSSRV